MSPLPSWRAVPIPGASIEMRLAVPAQCFFRIYECSDPTLEADHWVKANRGAVERELHDHGAVLLRGFRADRGTFARVADLISPVCIDYRGGNAPRSALPGNLYTSSELPASVTLVQHHEMMFSLC